MHKDLHKGNLSSSYELEHAIYLFWSFYELTFIPSSPVMRSQRERKLQKTCGSKKTSVRSELYTISTLMIIEEENGVRYYSKTLSVNNIMHAVYWLNMTYRLMKLKEKLAQQKKHIDELDKHM